MKLYIKFLQVHVPVKPAPAGFFCRAEMLFKTGFVLYTLQVTADMQLPGDDAWDDRQKPNFIKIKKGDHYDTHNHRNRHITLRDGGSRDAGDTLSAHY
ncbi:hypothetical protein BRYFOR_05035 [Marvinbryantia formatexigens DSM 14469]|uniref:Uncharacterized protein n=1 Tax=Marvinbryantia formatexigens DSM 14469 TaxID=478749 RepID=C6L8U6_9FIRM|nr:hypothetical protein BRYFOR_05035 [Marvinbryantia formatexigens DSM 14469]